MRVIRWRVLALDAAYSESETEDERHRKYFHLGVGDCLLNLGLSGLVKFSFLVADFDSKFSFVSLALASVRVMTGAV